MIALCMASCRQNELDGFLSAWAEQIDDLSVYVAWDGLHREYFDHKVINADLGKDSWIIPRGTSAIKSYAIYTAWREGADRFVVFDDDVRPFQGHEIELHTGILGRQQMRWQRTLKARKERGFPYVELGEIDIAMNHGLWMDNPDLDGPTALVQPTNWFSVPVQKHSDLMPKGKYFAMSGMNVSFTREIAPLMYFGLQGKDYPYDRFDDIWCGIIAKKIMDHLDLGILSGIPQVRHIKASNPFINLIKEAPGIEVNEWFWQKVDSVQLEGKTPIECYTEMAEKLPIEGEYWDKLKLAMSIWIKLFS